MDRSAMISAESALWAGNHLDVSNAVPLSCPVEPAWFIMTEDNRFI